MLLAHFETVPDPRRAQGRRYPLKFLLLFAILAILSGGRSYRDVSRFMEKKRKKLNQFFGLHWKKPPSKSQLRNVFCAIEIRGMESTFRAYSHSLNELTRAKKKNRVGP